MKKVCEFLNCKEEGIYPAPRSREDITTYKYYCIEHIRDFNKSWNFFEGLTEEEFESEIRKSTTWDRPSWKFGTSNYNKKINDPFNFFSDLKDENVSNKKINYKFNIYTNIKNITKLKNNIFEKKENSNLNNHVNLFVTVDQKLVNFNFNKYSIKSYKKLDDLNKSNILDYSLEIS